MLDIRYDAGYLVEPASEQGVAYFLGSIPGIPGEYYWRRVDKTDRGNNSRIRNPASWSQWLKIDAPLQPMPDSVPSIVYFSNRLHVVCLHEYPGGTTNSSGGVSADAEIKMKYELQIATLRPSGQWTIRSWPLNTSASGVFAAELRTAGQNNLSMLGVFLTMPDGINLIRFNELLQMLDSTGNKVTMSAQYLNKVFARYFDIIVRQPLAYQPPIPPATYALYTVFHHYVVGQYLLYEFSNLRFINNYGLLRLSIDVETGRTYPEGARIKFYKGGDILEGWGVGGLKEQVQQSVNFLSLLSETIPLPKHRYQWASDRTELT